MPNIYTTPLERTGDGRAARLGELAGSEHLGLSLYELEPGQGMVFHYHLRREELMIVLSGSLALRTADGWEDLSDGEVVVFPRGELGAHAYENRSAGIVRLLMVSEQNAPNVSVYPDANEVGIFDAARRADRRFGALFDVGAALSDYAGGTATIVPPARREPRP